MWPLLRVVSHDVHPMCDLCGLYCEWYGLSHQHLISLCFMLLNTNWEDLEGVDICVGLRTRSFENTIGVFQLFKTKVICPPHMSLRFLVAFFPNLSTNKFVILDALLKEASNNDLDPNVDEVLRIFFPPRLFFIFIFNIGWATKPCHMQWVGFNGFGKQRLRVDCDNRVSWGEMYLHCVTLLFLCHIHKTNFTIVWMVLQNGYT